MLTLPQVAWQTGRNTDEILTIKEYINIADVFFNLRTPQNVIR